MNKNELFEQSQNDSPEIDAYHPVIVEVNNEGNDGQWIDIFRKKEYPRISMCYLFGSISDLAISYDELVDNFRHEKFIIGMIGISSTILFPEIEKDNQKLYIVNWTVRGTAMVVPIEYPDTKDQEQKGIIQIKKEFMTDYTTFLRVWSPSNSKTTVSLYIKN